MNFPEIGADVMFQQQVAEIGHGLLRFEQCYQGRIDVFGHRWIQVMSVINDSRGESGYQAL